MIPENYWLYLQILFFLFITPGSPRVVMCSYTMSYGLKKSVWTALGDISANSLQLFYGCHISCWISSLLLCTGLLLIEFLSG